MGPPARRKSGVAGTLREYRTSSPRTTSGEHCARFVMHTHAPHRQPVRLHRTFPSAEYAVVADGRNALPLSDLGVVMCGLTRKTPE
jgi:hypothetical protein